MYGGLGKWENPYYVSNYANLLYRDYVDSGCKNNSARATFLLQAEHLLATADVVNGAALWRYPFENKFTKLPKGSISGIGQSRISSILWRAHVLTGEPKYREIAELGMVVYTKPLKEGGVLTVEDNVIWIEQAPDHINGISYKILNGHLTGLFGVFDYHQLTGNPKWKALFNRGVAAVVRDIAKFDAGATSFYLIDGMDEPSYAPLTTYNSGHVAQLRILYAMTGIDTLAHWANVFESYGQLKYQYSSELIELGYEADSLNFGKKSWYRKTLPAQVDIKFEKPGRVTRFLIMSRHNAYPSDFELSALVDGEWQTVSAMTDNKSTAPVMRLDTPVLTDQLRLVITKGGPSGHFSLTTAAPVVERLEDRH
jgi:hypothetical protein